MEVEEIHRLFERTIGKIEGQLESILAHLRKLNGHIARHDGEIKQMDKEVQELYLTFNTLNDSIAKMHTQLTHMQDGETLEIIGERDRYRKWLTRSAITLFVIFAVITYSILIQTGIVSPLTPLPL